MMMKGIPSLKKRLTTVAAAALLLAATQLSLASNQAFASYNYALGQYTWASNGTSSNAVDNSVSTIWQPSFGGSGWMIVDLGSVKTINQLVVKVPSVGHLVESIAVSTSTDNVTYTAQTSATYGFYSANGYTNTINLPSAVTTRYVQVSVAPAGTATMIGELEIYGP
ncbi:discoidin domain-containing protein [Paenibacillus athensensis]|uniref:F5/8 type C domain-containing protein n=1 Tax=Paenibacillus athensensis TaxID=1967502 RepID=A0A4Y8Q8L2_9BACL|nr:discoidin domain-containing protein [Paenibacillus athensensis]MCD1260014.1 discoidin domain-containing protein [Paenibacillus athensensis]